jgi:hypothetical protein
MQWPTGLSLVRFGQSIADGNGGGFCTLDGVEMTIQNGVANAMGAIVTATARAFEMNCVRNCTFYWDGDGVTNQKQVANVIAAGASPNFSVLNNRFKVQVVNPGPVDCINMTGVASLMFGNILQGFGVIPTFTNSGAGSIGNNTNNVVRA